MNMKIMLLLIIVIMLVACTGGVFADTISNYSVPASVPLGNNVTATGLFEDSNGLKSGFLCSFYFFEQNTGVLVKRATDQYSTSTGRVTMAGFPINEPLFKRDQNYTLRTECGTTFADANFLVAQRESIAHTASQEFEFITEPENTDTGFIWGTIIAVIIIAVLLLLYFYRVARR